MSNGSGQACQSDSKQRIIFIWRIIWDMTLIFCMWWGMHKFIWFSPFIWVWSGSPGRDKNNFQYWVFNISRLNGAMMLIFVYGLRLEAVNLLTVLSCGPKMISASQVAWCCNAKYLQSGLTSWFCSLHDSLASWLEPSKDDLIANGFWNSLQVSPEV